MTTIITCFLIFTLCCSSIVHSDPFITFSDQTSAAGIRTANIFGGKDKRYILEAHGSGAAFFDADNDADLDLYILNGSPFDTFRDLSGPGNAFYRNNGSGIFDEIKGTTRLEDPRWSAGCAIGDIDNNGLRDVYVTNYGRNSLYLNTGGNVFEDITLSAAVGGNSYSSSAAFFDYDLDGDLDLYVANYVEFDAELLIAQGSPSPSCRFIGGIEVYCGPKGMPGAADVLYRNEGNRVFTDVTEESGIAPSVNNYGLGVVVGDYDSDGFFDLFVANDETPNTLLRNTGDGHFVDVALRAGFAYNGDGDEEAGMGIDLGDYDNDGDEDVHITNFFNETNTLYRNDNGKNFVDITTHAGLATPSVNSLAWATKFADFDNDGFLDLFAANGHVYPQVAQVMTGSDYAQTDQVFRNLGNGSFEDLSALAGPGMQIKRVGRGGTFGDYDNDGDTDVFIVNLNDLPTLLRNESGSANYWLKVQAIGSVSNRDGLGSLIKLTANGRSQYRTVRGSGSYLSHNDTRAHFGLGLHSTVETLSIVFPSGKKITIENIAANTMVMIHEDGRIDYRNF